MPLNKKCGLYAPSLLFTLGEGRSEQQREAVKLEKSTLLPPQTFQSVSMRHGIPNCSTQSLNHGRSYSFRGVGELGVKLALLPLSLARLFDTPFTKTRNCITIRQHDEVNFLTFGYRQLRSYSCTASFFPFL